MFIIPIYFCAVFLSVNCQPFDLQDIQHVRRLKEYLFNRTRYDKNVVPRLNQSEPVEVNVHLALLSIDGLDEAAETFKATGYLNIWWKDDLLTWNATDFGDFYHSYFPQADVWKPDMALMNSYTIDKDNRKLADDSTMVKVLDDGLVLWYPFQIFHTTCSIDIHYFPFDIQRCELQFGAWPYFDNEVKMNVDDKEGIDMKRCEGNPQWEVQPFGHDVIDFDSTSVARFSLKLTRKPLYVLLTVFLPMILLSILNMFVFILPCESGERSGYAITVFLAFAVFLTIVSTTLPPSSDTVAISSVFLIILIVQSTLITAISLMLVRCYSFEDEAPVPKILQWFLQFITCTVCSIENKSVVKLVQVKSFVVSEMAEIIENQSNEQTNDSIKDKGKQRAGMDLTWKEAVRKLDIICMIFFFVTFLVSLVACTCVAVLQP